MSVVSDKVHTKGELVARSFVRLAPTTLFKAPECYGDYERILRPVDVGIPSSEDQCSLCPVRLQCSQGQGVEVKLVEPGRYD